MPTPINRTQFQTVLNNSLTRLFNFTKYRTVTESLADYVYGVGIAGTHPAMSLGIQKAGLVMDNVAQTIQFLGSPMVNVLWQGVDNQGGNDISPTVNNILNAGIGSVLFFPKGDYLIDSNLLITKGCELVGEEGTFFNINNVGIGIKVSTTIANGSFKFLMRNISVNAGGLGIVGSGIIDIEDAVKTDLENVKVFDTGQFAPSGNKYYGIQIRRSIDVPFVHNTTRIYNCEVNNCRGGGIKVDFGTKNVRIIDSTVSNCGSDGTALTLANGIDLVGSENCIITGCTVSGNEGNGIYISSYSSGANQLAAKNISINNNDIQQNAISTWGTGQECAGIAWQNKNPSLKGWGTVFENRVVGNGSPFVASNGIMIIDDNDVNCHDNNVYDNTKHGIKLHNTSACVVTKNKVIKSSTIANTDALIEMTGSHSVLNIIDNYLTFNLPFGININATLDRCLILDNINMTTSKPVNFASIGALTGSTIRYKFDTITSSNAKQILPMPPLAQKRPVRYKAIANTRPSNTADSTPKYGSFSNEMAVVKDNLNVINPMGGAYINSNLFPTGNGMEVGMINSPNVFEIYLIGFLSKSMFWQIELEFRF
jgi:parallel beta-helix repeat protein